MQIFKNTFFSNLNEHSGLLALLEMMKTIANMLPFFK